MDSKFFVASVFSLIALATLTACGGDGGGGPTSYTYNSTTSRGDLVNYTITGSNASIQWHVTNNVGAISFTWNTTATCGAHDATYGHRTCTIVSSTCTAGVEACPVTLPSGDIEILEIPGTALIAHVPTAVAWLADGSTHDELHTGFISGGCPADVSGDYAYVSTGRANGTNSATDLFGIYRSDATFNEITHADFGMTTVGSAALNTAVANYVTSDTAGAVTLTGDSCANGIFTRGLNGQTTRLNITQGSGFIFDFPAGQGGLIALKTSTAALLADLAGRNWRGISFPDTIEPELLSVTT
ncbi:MAG TPA: hypothetical protein VFY78_07080, partial [Gammaproteobacteria bacterium]|nr:hypothetical protein [Gammaproteobacteria bacterium]